MACNVTQLAKSMWQLVFFNLHMLEITITEIILLHTKKNLRKLQILSPRQYGWLVNNGCLSWLYVF